jgi:hypothetical protein
VAVFECDHIFAQAVVQCSATNGLQVGWISYTGEAVDLAFSWLVPAAPYDTVTIYSSDGSINSTLSSGQTSVSMPNRPLGEGIFTVIIYRSTYSVDTVNITVDKLGGGKFANASARGMTRSVNAMALQVSGITEAYDYNIRNCTTNTNASSSGTDSAIAVSAPVSTPDAISFIEVVNSGDSFSYPNLSVDTCVPTPTATPTEYFVTMSQSAGGTLSFRSGFEPTHGGGYYSGEAVEIEYALSLGYTFLNWYSSGVTLTTTTPGKCSFYMPPNNCQVSASFGYGTPYIVTGISNGSGNLKFNFIDPLGTEYIYSVSGLSPAVFVNTGICAISIVSSTYGTATLSGQTCTGDIYIPVGPEDPNPSIRIV